MNVMGIFSLKFRKDFNQRPLSGFQSQTAVFGFYSEVFEN